VFGVGVTARFLLGVAFKPHPQAGFQITSGPGGTGCSDPLPFAPSVVAGTTNINAGAFSDLSTTLSREDGQQSVQPRRVC
jgi:hypothetical protein